MNATYLTIKWTVSRAADTYGYNRVTLSDTQSGKRYVAVGGGYDMTGAVLGEWLAATYQPQLQALAATLDSKPYGNPAHGVEQFPALYGMTRDNGTDKVRLDGACGRSSMERIAQALGLTLHNTVNKRGHLTGIQVS